MDTIYQKNIVTDDAEDILSQMNRFDDYTLIRPGGDIPGPLKVDLKKKNGIYNKKYIFRQVASDSVKFEGMPSSLSDVSCDLARNVYFLFEDVVMVELVELRPTVGRRWLRLYNNTSGWTTTDWVLRVPGAYAHYTPTKYGPKVAESSILHIYSDGRIGIIYGGVRLNAGTYSTDDLIFTSPIHGRNTVFSPLSGPAFGCKVNTNGDVCLNGGFTLDTAMYIYLQIVFPI